MNDSIPALSTRKLDLYYGSRHALKSVDLEIPARQVTAIIGPSGCGKTTLLRCFNRLNELVPDCRVEGEVCVGGRDVHAPGTNVSLLRQQVGMVFQNPNPFPRSIADNVAYGLRLRGIRGRRELDERIERALRAAGLWEEVNGRLDDLALKLSGGQQQRLVIARAIAVEPDVLLLDEPGASLDPISMLRVEELISVLKQRYTVVVVTHNMQQAARVSDFTAFMDDGQLIEFGTTDDVFTNPTQKQTEDYITGRYG